MHTDSLDMTAPELSFQHYKVLRQTDGSPWELGRGSMGITYKAFDVNLCCEVALKVINSATLEHPHARERFVSEARAAAKLRHRNIASVYHLGNDGEHYFYAMEFVDGETLDALVRRQGPLPVDMALRILLQAARALAAASRQGLVHRDLKPANLMVTREDDDDELLVKVIDFGLAKPIASADGSRPLTFGGFVGTPQFASPEQLEERPVDARSDIYSLGATTWFLLTGRAPFVGPLATICQQHLTQPPPWSQLPKPFPETVRTLLAHMLEKSPLRRPADAVELRRQIEASLEVIREPQGTFVPVHQKFVARAPNWVRPRQHAPSASVMPAEGDAPRTGMILKGRYELLRLVGEGNSGRVFVARDRGENEALVAVKILHPELVATAAERSALEEEVKLIQAAPAPQLTRIAALESLLSQETVFLVEEWLCGFTLLDFLAVRGGALPMAESLRLLEQAAAVADHAKSRGLERLTFALHQFHLHFPALVKSKVDDSDSERASMLWPMAQWPAWILKLNPLGSLRKGLEASTWAGDVTLIPGAVASTPGARTASRSGLVERDAYIAGVAQLAYEFLGGAPASPEDAADGQAKYVSLPALNEEGNAVLQRALSATDAFSSATDFYASFARVSGGGGTPFLPTTGLTGNTQNPREEAAAKSFALGNDSKSVTGTRPKDSTLGDAMGDAPTLVPMPFSAATNAPLTEATFGSDGEPHSDDLSVWTDQRGSTGSVWDRLVLVSGHAAKSRLWVGGVILAFGMLLVGSFVFLKALGRRVPNKPTINVISDKSKKKKQYPVTADGRAKTSVPTVVAIPPSPRASSPSPTIARSPALTVSTPGTSASQLDTQPANSPWPRPSDSANAVPLAATPVLTPAPSEPEGTPPPLNAPRESVVRLHVTSKPAGVEVFLKGKPIGTTPLDTRLPAGDYQLIARYKTWPEVHQTVHLGESQSNAEADLRMMPPTLVPTASATATPISRSRRAQQEETVRRNFVRSTRGPDGSTGASAAQTPVVPERTNPAGTPEVRRALPKLHPFDPDGTFRPSPPPAGD